MGETSSQLTAHGDPTSAMEVIKILSKYLDFEVDLSELDKAAEGFDALLKKIATAPKEEAKNEPVDYIR
jgi:proteasome assembly chaperone (PAC2) family protein